MLTRYQDLIVKYLEAKHGMPADKVILWLRKRNRYSEIAELIGCSRMTLRTICRELGVNDSDTKVIIGRLPVFQNATSFFKRFDRVEDAVAECRDELGLTVEEAAVKLGVSRSTVVRYTPDYLKYIQNLSKEGLDRKRAAASRNLPSPDHPWRERTIL